MSYFIDRRSNARNKSAVNRQRFIRRYRSHIKRAVEDAVNRRSITDMERGEEVSIPTRDISEPVFQHGQGGKRRVINPGNKEFVEGDRMRRPSGGGGEAAVARARPPIRARGKTTLPSPCRVRNFSSSSSTGWNCRIWSASRSRTWKRCVRCARGSRVTVHRHVSTSCARCARHRRGASRCVPRSSGR